MSETDIQAQLREHVTKPVEFAYYQTGELHYETHLGLDFVVPVGLTFTARFGRTESGLSMMKFIKAQLIRNEEGRKESR